MLCILRRFINMKNLWMLFFSKLAVLLFPTTLGYCWCFSVQSINFLIKHLVKQLVSVVKCLVKWPNTLNITVVCRDMHACILPIHIYMLMITCIHACYFTRVGKKGEWICFTVIYITCCYIGQPNIYFFNNLHLFPIPLSELACPLS